MPEHMGYIGPLVWHGGDVLECALCLRLITPGQSFGWAPADVHHSCWVAHHLRRGWQRCA